MKLNHGKSGAIKRAPGEYLARKREEAGLSQRALAEAVGVSHVFIRNMESGQCPIPEGRRAALEEALGIPPLESELWHLGNRANYVKALESLCEAAEARSTFLRPEDREAVAPIAEKVSEAVRAYVRAPLPRWECFHCGGECFDQYMVSGEVWQRVRPEGPRRGRELLHLECLEMRLGRRIQADDLTDAPINNTLLLVLGRANVGGVEQVRQAARTEIDDDFTALRRENTELREKLAVGEVFAAKVEAFAAKVEAFGVGIGEVIEELGKDVERGLEIVSELISALDPGMSEMGIAQALCEAREWLDEHPLEVEE